MKICLVVVMFQYVVRLMIVLSLSVIPSLIAHAENQQSHSIVQHEHQNHIVDDSVIDDHAMHQVKPEIINTSTNSTDTDCNVSESCVSNCIGALIIEFESFNCPFVSNSKLGFGSVPFESGEWAPPLRPPVI